MNDLYRKTFDEIHASEALRQEVLNMTRQEKAAAKRQVPRMLLIAAIVVLVLAGTALAAALPGIQEWFSQQWTAQTGRPIHTNQLGLIDQLSDAVGVSAESGGITMTVDSVTRGENVIWFLLEIDGLPPEAELEEQYNALERPKPKEDSTSTRKEFSVGGTNVTIFSGDPADLPEEMFADTPLQYSLGPWSVTFDPEISDPQFSHNGGIRQASEPEDSSMKFLLRHFPTLTGEATLLDALDVTLELTELSWGNSFLRKELAVAEGPFTLRFSLPAIQPAKPLTTGGGTALGEPWPDFDSMDLPAISASTDPQPTEEMAFLGTQVTATGLTVFWADEEQTTRLSTEGDWYLIMADGAEVPAETNLSMYNDLPDGQRVSLFIWPVPVNLDQAKSLEYRYGEDVQSFALK